MTDYIVEYGCYLDTQYVWVRTDEDLEDVQFMAYELAYQATENWVGMHGFVDEEDVEGMEEDEEAEYIHQEIENAAQYIVHPFTQDMYECYCSDQERPQTW